MSGRMKFAIAGVILGLILFIVSPWLAIGVIVLAIGIPTGMYLMLDPSQRRRLQEIRAAPADRRLTPAAAGPPG